MQDVQLSLWCTEKDDFNHRAMLRRGSRGPETGPRVPVYNTVANQGNSPRGHRVAHMFEPERKELLNSLFGLRLSIRDPTVLSHENYPNPNSNRKQIRMENANWGHLGEKQRGNLDDLLHHCVTGESYFSSEQPQPCHARADGELPLFLINETCTSVAAKRRRFRQQKVLMVRKEILSYTNNVSSTL